MARTLTVVSKSLGMYYQKNGSGPAVAPTFDDPLIDIDSETKTRSIRYLAEITAETNRYPVSPTITAGSPQEYGTNFQNITTQDTQQLLRQPDLASSVAPVDQNAAWFPSSFVTPDKLGVYESDIERRPRAFNVSKYMEAPIPANEGDSPIDKAILNATGYNQSNKFVRENILSVKQTLVSPQNINSNPDNPVNGIDYRFKLGSTGFQTLGLFGTGSHVGQQGQSSPKRTELTIADMQKVGLNLLFDAVQGEYANPEGQQFIIQNESDFAEAEARMAVPTTNPAVQLLGKKSSLSRFTPSYTLKKLTNQTYSPSGVTNFYDNTNDVQTYGNLYSPFNQFDSLVSVGQIALAVALILAFVLLLEAIAGIMYLIMKDDNTDQNVNSVLNADPSSIQNTRTIQQLQQLLGTSKISGEGGLYPNNSINAGDFISQLLGVSGLVTTTVHNPGSCLDAGIAEFFGFSFGTVGQNISSGAATALRILIENGRMVTTLREILRSGISVVEGGISDFSGGFSISALGKTIRKIRDLKIVKFINVLREIGDKVLSESDIRDQVIANRGELTSGSNVSYVDSLPDNNRAYYIAKSKLTNKKMAWSSETAGLLSLPFFGTSNDQTINKKKTNLEEALNGPINGSNLYGNQNSSVWGENSAGATARSEAEKNGRIPSEVVARYEEELEADYMPFYIQDLRTNEILSFHAFLEDVGEDFKIDYSTVEGYGRMDKVHIYKGTTRDVNVTFKMVATNEEDHAIMWYKINKLAMVIYPQWTQGREINYGNPNVNNGQDALNFIQPFSQIPGATPVIRLRVGDLFKSNYSAMAVARLFGATTLPNYKVDNSQQNATGLTNNTGEAGTTATTATNQTPAPSPTPTGATDPTTAQATSPETAPVEFLVDIAVNETVFAKHTQISRGLFVTKVNSTNKREALRGIINPSPSGDVLFKCTCKNITTNEEGKLYQFETVGVVEGNSVKPIFLFREGRNPRSNEIRPNPTFNILEEDLETKLDVRRTNDAIIRERNSARNTNARTNPTIQMTTRDFYSETSNPIIKAFKNSGGKGLAGVVTSFKIDHKDSTWGTSKNQKLRAPIMVTVNLTMTVIHDIVPGLDANGIMNAPIWPVGTHSNFFMKQSTPETDIAVDTGADYFFNNQFTKRR